MAEEQHLQAYIYDRLKGIENKYDALVADLRTLERGTSQQLRQYADEARQERQANTRELQDTLQSHIKDLNARIRELEGTRQYTLGQYAAYGIVVTVGIAIGNLLSGVWF